MAHRLVVGFLLGFLLLIAAGSMSLVTAQEENVGILQVAEMKHPRQVAPSTHFQFVIDVEYGTHSKAEIKSALFEGAPSNLGKEIWQSEPVEVSDGGDKIWSLNLTSPSTEQTWFLTVFAYYLEGGKWNFYNDTDHGPSYAQTSIKISKLANLEIDLSMAEVPVTIDNSTEKTPSSGNLTLQLTVGASHQVALSPLLELKNGTRLIFVKWNDNVNTTQRTLLLEGDMRIVASYKIQYRLKVDSVLSAYRLSGWYDAGSNVTLQADRTVRTTGPFEILGLQYVFRGWSGRVNSSSLAVNVTMNEPKDVNANYSLDYTPLVLPTILTIGIAGGIFLFLLRRHRTPRTTVVEQETLAEETESNRCENCGEQVEEGWTHCTNCGKPLGSSESAHG